MGTWDIKIDANDTFQDVYQQFFAQYNEGVNPHEISGELLDDIAMTDADERHDSLFALALAQWETKALDPAIFSEVQKIIEEGHNIELWKRLDADEKTLQRRHIELEKFLVKISTEKEKPKRRVKPKREFKYITILSLPSPDGACTLGIGEGYVNDIYQDTTAILSPRMGGGAIFNFSGIGKSITARWIDEHTLEITHDKDILFRKKDETFYHADGKIQVIYLPQ